MITASYAFLGCTVFNCVAQTAASVVPRLLGRDVSRFRVEFVRETGDEARRVLSAYRDLLAGRTMPAEVARRLTVEDRIGVLEGAMSLLV